MFATKIAGGLIMSLPDVDVRTGYCGQWRSRSTRGMSMLVAMSQTVDPGSPAIVARENGSILLCAITT